MQIKEKRKKLERRHHRIRAKVSGTGKIPRLCVYRSLKYIYAQIINDEEGLTLISVSDRDIKVEKNKAGKFLSAKTKSAFEVGKILAEQALSKKIERIVFDRGGRVYHGRVKALAEGARKGGLKF